MRPSHPLPALLLLVSLPLACTDKGGAGADDTGLHTGTAAVGTADAGTADAGTADAGTADAGSTTDPWADAPTVLRLGPPTPTAGAYGVAADPSTGQVYVSNLHVPFITLVDPDTGGWAGSLDLRDAGASTAFFPRLYVYDSTLWVSDLDSARLWRFSLPDHSPLDAVELIPNTVALSLADDGLWGLSGTVLTRYDETGQVQSLRSPVTGTTVSVGLDSIAVVDTRTGELVLLDRDGFPLWQTTVADTRIESVLAWGDRLFYTDRILGDVVAMADGKEVARRHVGSDAFHLDRLDDMVIVTVRQGAALPDSGAYQGDPGLVTALDTDLGLLWQAQTGKTVHFTAFDGSRLWTMAEDSLQASAIDPATGDELLRGPRLGLTIDHLQPVEDRVWLGSHLTDEVWALDLPGHGLDGLAATAIDVCGWPFRVVPDNGQGVVVCQESGDVARIDLNSLSLSSTEDWADTFHVVCEDGLCTGHKVFASLAVLDDSLLGEQVTVASPRTAALQWQDGSQVVLADADTTADLLQHFDVAPLADGLLTFEPRQQQLAWLPAGDPLSAVSLTPALSTAATFPLVPDGDRIWAGTQAWQEGPTVAVDLTVSGTTAAVLTESASVEAAGAGVVILRDDDQLVVLDRDSLAEVGRLALSELMVPPLLSLGGDLGPLRLAVDEDTDSLLVGNLLLGTVEVRALPDLSARGTGEIRAVGRWADL